MIRPIDIRLNAAHPDYPLAEAVTFTGSPSTVLIRGVPPNCGRWAITAVSVAATFPDGSTTTRAAVQSANGVWVATLPATATSGRTANGLRILADGIDENGEAATGYILAVADFAVASLGVTPAPQPGETSYQMLYFDAVPGVLRKGDVAKIDGVLKFYNGTAWEAFAGDIPAPSTATPAMDGTGAAGTSAAFARGDHVHPSDSTKLDKSGGTMTGGLTMDGGNLITFSDQSGTRTMTIGLSSDGFEINLYSYGTLVYTWRTPYNGGIFALASELSYKLDSTSAAPAFTAKTYAVGDHVTYNGALYRCTTAVTTAGAWDASKWTADTVAMKAANPTNGNLAALDANGNPTDSGKKPSDFQSALSAQQLANIAAVPDKLDKSGGTMTGSLTLYEPQNGAEIYFPSGGKAKLQFGSGLLKVDDTTGRVTINQKDAAVVDNIPYALITKTVTNGAVSLDDRAINAVAVSSSLASLTVNFPTATSGKARDFGLRLTVASGITTAPQIVLPQGVTCENADGEAPEIGADGAATILYFTETASGVFLVKGEVLQTIA